MQPSASDVVASPAWARAAATLSWLLPLGALVALGVSEQGGALVPVSRVPGPVLIGGVLVVAALGLAVGGVALRALRADGAIRRRALLGTCASATVLVVAAVASLAGAASRGDAELDLQRATNDALRGAPGWNGGAVFGGARVLAFELYPTTDLAKRFGRGLDRPYRIVLLSVGNGGAKELQVVGAEATAHHAGGALARAVAQSASLRVAPGAQADGVTVLFEPGERFDDVDWIEVSIDGAARRVPGRYFTLEEKRRIDARRAGADAR